MNALIVGAGSIGQVFGRHLALGGAQVSVLVLPDQVDQAQAGFAMVPLNRLAPRSAIVRWWPHAVLTRLGAEGIAAYDQVWLCLPSPALQGPWLEALLASPGLATVVLLTAALGDRERVLDHLAEHHLVQGMIALVSYPGPLAGEDLPEPATVYWFPPASSTRFAGPAARVKDVVAALQAGGLPAAAAEGQTRVSAATGAVVMPHLVAMECAGWSLQALRKGELLDLAREASQQAEAIVARVEGADKPDQAPPTLLVRLLLGLAPAVLPFPVEAYLALHFTKVGSQTRLNMERYIQAGRDHGLPTTALELLMQRLRAAGPSPD